MRLKDIEPIPSTLSRCIEVEGKDRLFAAGGATGEAVVSHNSVAQRNIIISCILRPDSWRFLGIDLKKVELSAFRAYSNVVLGVATTLEDALTVLRFAQETMMKRYAEMEQLGVNNFLDLPEKGQALLVMTDEAGELLSRSGVKALAESTIIPTPYGPIRLSDLQVGDIIWDNNSQRTTVTEKYEPAGQERFRLTISQDATGEAEAFTAGAEHNWVAYFQAPSGAVTGPEVVDTAALHAFKKEQALLPPEERTQVKFKKLVPVTS